MKPRIHVGVIGLGVIGYPIAKRLVEAGFSTFVFDVRREPVDQLQALGALACNSSAEVATHSDVVISLVADEPQTLEVISGKLGLLSQLKSGTILMIGSTLGPESVVRLANSVAQKACVTIDMPITGGFVAAEKGELTLMLGGNNTVIETVMPVMQAFASRIIRAGDIGAGQSAKLAHQIVMGINILGLLEGLALGVASGVAPQVMRQILEGGLANSQVLQVWDDMGERWKSMLKAQEGNVPLPNLRKDFHSALQQAQELGLDLPLATLGSRLADTAKATGHEDPSL